MELLVFLWKKACFLTVAKNYLQWSFNTKHNWFTVLYQINLKYIWHPFFKRTKIRYISYFIRNAIPDFSTREGYTLFIMFCSRERQFIGLLCSMSCRIFFTKSKQLLKVAYTSGNLIQLYITTLIKYVYLWDTVIQQGLSIRLNFRIYSSQIYWFENVQPCFEVFGYLQGLKH